MPALIDTIVVYFCRPSLWFNPSDSNRRKFSLRGDGETTLKICEVDPAAISVFWSWPRGNDWGCVLGRSDPPRDPFASSPARRPLPPRGGAWDEARPAPWDARRHRVCGGGRGRWCRRQSGALGPCAPEWDPRPCCLNPLACAWSGTTWDSVWVCGPCLVSCLQGGAKRRPSQQER